MRPHMINEKYSGGFDFSTPEFYKGGTPSAPTPPSPMAEAEAQMSLERERARLAQEQAARDDAAKAAKDQELRSRVSGQVGNAYNSALSYGSNRLQSAGINDSYGIMDAYRNLLDTTRNGLSPTDESAASQLSGHSLFDTAYNEQRGIQRQKNARSLQTFAGDGFDESLLKNTDDDSILNAIMGRQYDDARTTIQRAKDRGQINDTGFGYSLGDLDRQKLAGMSRAQQAGLGVLNTDRKGLRDLASGFTDKANNYDFGDTFDINSMRDRLSNKANEYKGGLEGDIYNAIGDTNYFNTDTLLGKAGSYQGAQNLTGKTSNPLATAFAQAPTDEEEAKRTLGTVGAF